MEAGGSEGGVKVEGAKATEPLPDVVGILGLDATSGSLPALSVEAFILAFLAPFFFLAGAAAAAPLAAAAAAGSGAGACAEGVNVAAGGALTRFRGALAGADAGTGWPATGV